MSLSICFPSALTSIAFIRTFLRPIESPSVPHTNPPISIPENYIKKKKSLRGAAILFFFIYILMALKALSSITIGTFFKFKKVLFS